MLHVWDIVALVASLLHIIRGQRSPIPIATKHTTRGEIKGLLFEVTRPVVIIISYCCTNIGCIPINIVRFYFIVLI